MKNFEIDIVNKNEQPNTWSKVVSAVQNSNIEQIKKIKWQQNSRKSAYKKQLDSQVQEIQKNRSLQRSRRNQQRLQLEKQVRQQKINANIVKIKKVRTQQKYQVQNLSLISSTKKNQKDLSMFPQNPFVSLVDRQDSRNRQTKRSFIMQNRLNDIQISVHRQLKQRKSKQEQQFLQQIKKYQQKSQERQKLEKQKFNSKYLKISQFENPNFKSMQISTQKNYKKFLDSQVNQLNNKRFRKQTLDISLQQINKHVQIPDSSPAYLGRNPMSYDRQKQLKIIDRKLNNPSFHNLTYLQSYRTEPSHQLRSQSMFQSKPIKNTSNQRNLPSIYKTIQTQTSTYQIINKNVNKQHIFKNSDLKRQKYKKQLRKYNRYDFITGTKKTIVL